MKTIDYDENQHDYLYEQMIYLRLFIYVLQPIEDRKLNWQKTPRINQQNDDYIERMRQKRSEPTVKHERFILKEKTTFLFIQIFRENVKWRTPAAKVDHHNEQYVEAVKDRTRPRVSSSLSFENQLIFTEYLDSQSITSMEISSENRII